MGKYPEDIPGKVRWVNRPVPAPEYGPNIQKPNMVLQQEWRDSVTGDVMWRDVPVETE